MEILFVQHGDYGAAYGNMLACKKETYRDQFRSVRFVSEIATTHTVRVLSFCTRPHKEQLTPSLFSIGIEKNRQFRANLDKALKSFKTDLLICRTPQRQTLRWAAKNHIITLPCFADTFDNTSLRSKLQNIRLMLILKNVSKPCVANHSLNASKSLMNLGIHAKDIVPWDWRPLESIYSGKSAPDIAHTLSIMYIGVLSKAKGLDTVIDAISILKTTNKTAILNIAGQGDLEFWQNYVKQRQVKSQVNFLGTIPAETVLPTMNDNDIIVVPSKHEYPEGLPNTIFEALASRTPLIISDHPAFIGRLKTRENCLSFTADSADNLAERLNEIKENPNLYELISKNSAEALKNLYIGEDWCSLITYFLSDPYNKTKWTERINISYLMR